MIEHLQMHLQYENNLQIVQSHVKLFSRTQSHVKLTELKTNFHSLVACKCYSSAVMSFFPIQRYAPRCILKFAKEGKQRRRNWFTIFISNKLTIFKTEICYKAAPKVASRFLKLEA